MPKSNMTLAERFWAKVDKTGEGQGCWTWTAACTTGGYGQFNLGGGRKAYVHRLAYEWLVGAIPDGLVIDHLCRNRLCCNPAHLEPVVQRTNVERGRAVLHVDRWQDASATKKRGLTHCKYGHPFDEANTIQRKAGRRGCRACQTAYQRELRASRRGPSAAAAG